MELNSKKTFFLIFVSFLFSIFIRLIWVYQFDSYDAFKFNDEFMINTNDGYIWAEGARDILAGGHQENDLSPIQSAVSQLTAFIAKILPVPFETIIFYIPAFFSSLVVIPLILIGRSLGKVEVGFIAALIASIAWSYYNRTMVGYYDTDMLNIVFPLFLLWSLILAVRTKEEKYILFTGLEIIAYRWWYPQSYSLEFAFFVLILAYVVYLAFKKQEFNYELKLIITMLFAMVYLPSFVRIVIVVLLYTGFKKELLEKYLYYLLAVAFLIFTVTGGLNPIWSQLKGYVFKDHISISGTDELKLHFYTVMQTIREAGKIPFETFANRISGHTVTFVMSVIGYLWLVIRYKAMLLALPLLGLGFLAYGIPGLIPAGGLRFTIYAVPVMALGIAYLIVEVSRLISDKLQNKRISLITYYSLLITLMTLSLAPNVKHVINYKVPTVFSKDEVSVLDKLKSIAGREDYVISWWDYGYPIRYYADVKTLADGGKHSGAVNFPVSYALTNPELQAAKMARLDVEYTEQAFKLSDEKRQSSNIAQMTLDYGFKDANDFLAFIKTDIKLPKKTRDIYFYLPFKMLNIYPTVTLFSNLDLMTGKKKKEPLFYISGSYNEGSQYIDIGNNIKLLKKGAKLIVGKKQTTIKRFVKTMYEKSGKLSKQIQHINSRSNINVIYMSNYKTFLVVDDKIYNSLYFKLFVLEEYDEDLFEPTILSPLAKVYKLKI